MEWYRYNPDTLEYEHPVICQPNPARPGEFLIPPSATELEPPTAGDHEAAVFQPGSNCWTVTPDFRGTDYWLPDGSHHTIERIGEVMPEGALDQPPPDFTAIHHINGQVRQQRFQKAQQLQDLKQLKQLMTTVNHLQTIIKEQP